MTFDDGIQTCLAILTIAGMWLMARAEAYARKQLRAWSVMLLAQPFWLASTWIASQWGMFLVALISTGIAIHAIDRCMKRLQVWRTR